MLAYIKQWLDTEGQIVLPRSPMGQAITYAQNQWTALTTYTTQGFLNIDNNASERALTTGRPWPQELALRRPRRGGPKPRPALVPHRQL